MNITHLCCSLHTATTTRRWSHQVQCTADAITPPISSHVAAIERPARPQQSGPPISQLGPMQLQEPQMPGWHPQQADRLLHLQPPQLQHQQHTHQYASHAEAVAAPLSQHSAGVTVGNGPFHSPPSATGYSAAPAPQKQKQRKPHKQSKRNKASQQANSLADQQQQQRYVQPTKDQAPIKFTPCGKRDGYKVAAAVSRQLSKGEKVLMPAGTGMQLARSTAMLSAARSMMLGHNSSSGLVFQPSLSTKAAAAAGGFGLQQQQHRQQQQWQHFGSADDRTSSTNGASTSAPSGSNARPSSGSGSSSSSASKGVMLLVAALPELQLRRFDQQPLVVARSTRAVALSSAIFARLCKQGYTTVRAAGPEATRLAMLAAAHARGKLIGCGLDLAVVPATEYVDVETLAASIGGTQYSDYNYNQAAAAAESAESQEGYGPGEELPKQFVQVTVLHLVRCVAGEPWKLLPWPVPTEQLPAVQYAAQQQQQQVPGAVAQLREANGHQQQQQPQQQQQALRVVPGAAVVAASGARQQQQQQVAADDQLQRVELYGLVSSGLAAHRGGSNGRSGSSSNGAERYTGDATAVGSESLPQVVQPASVAAAQLLQAGARVWRDVAPVVDPSAALLLSADGLLSPEQLHAGLEKQQQQQQQDEADKEPHTLGSASRPGGSSSNIVSRQPGGLLLQHKNSKKGSRQLVAAAQASSSNTATPSCSSS